MLTEAGERYFAMITDEIERISEATGTIRGFRSVTTLVMRATPTLSNKWLLPRLGAFWMPSRTSRCGWTGPTSRPTSTASLSISKFGTATVAGRACSSRGWPRRPSCRPARQALAPAGSLTAADLPRFRLIHSVKSQAQWGRWFALAGVQPQERWRRVLFDRSHMAIDAAVAGMGIALESRMMMERELASGALVCPVAQPPQLRLVTQWIVCPRDHLRQKKVRRFLDWLRPERDASNGDDHLIRTLSAAQLAGHL